MFRDTKKQRVENVNNKKNNVLFRQDRRSKDLVISDFNNIDAFVKSRKSSVFVTRKQESRDPVFYCAI